MSQYILYAIYAGLFTWGMTALGAGLVFFVRSDNQKFLDGMLAFAGGVMIAASFWSLIAPGLAIAEENGQLPLLHVGAGFLLGGVFLKILDSVVPHLHERSNTLEGEPSKLSRSALLMLAITLHNIPEGLAVGVAFGAVANGIGGAEIAGAIALTIGIGIQNFPEGAAVSFPLVRENHSKKKAFMLGQLSGIVELFAAIIGVLLTVVMTSVLPFFLAFAAGAMVYVVVEELIPEAQRGKHSDKVVLYFMLGFFVMMCLDVALG